MLDFDVKAGKRWQSAINLCGVLMMFSYTVHLKLGKVASGRTGVRADTLTIEADEIEGYDTRDSDCIVFKRDSEIVTIIPKSVIGFIVSMSGTGIIAKSEFESTEEHDDEDD